ncbi:MAG: toprim domain-containing protein [Chloroflexi bacterium]|nr:toprim domain-containing protein [Chloroflexota bacterium]
MGRTLPAVCEWFRQRIMFPNLVAGRTTYLTGRILCDQQSPKYLHIKGEKPLFVCTVRRGCKEMILVEGPLDAIALWQLGYSAAALLGTVMKAELKAQISGCDPRYICLDQDTSGQKGGRVLAQQLGPKARVVSLPDGVNDPCDFVEKGYGRDDFERLLADSKDLIEWQVEQIEVATDKVRLADRLGPILDQLAELPPPKADAYLTRRIARRFNLNQRDLAPYRSLLSQRRKELRQRATIEEIHAEAQRQSGAGGAELVESTDSVDPAVVEKAGQLLANPALLYWAGRMIQHLGVAGEDANLRLLYLIVSSRILPEPISATVKGESSAGKSYLVEKTLRIFPSSAYLAMTGMSRQALVYREESFAHKTIVMFERPGVDAADYNIRTLQSEGKIVFEVAEKNLESGRWETRRVEKEGPTNFILTTTSPELHSENETRHWSLLVDESPEQTLAAKLESAQRYGKEGGPVEDELAVWQQLQNEIRPFSVRIPYARWLALHTPNRPLRMRRDFKRLLALIEIVALLHQRQRYVNEHGVLEAELADYFMARELADQVFPASLSGINKKIEGLVSAVEAIYRDKKGKGEAEPVVKSTEIASALDVSAASVSRWLRPALDVGLVEAVMETSRGYVRAVKPGSISPKALQFLPTSRGSC